MKYGLVFIGFFFLTVIGRAQTQKNTIEKALEVFVSENGLAQASVSFHCIDLSTKATIAAHNSQLSLPPASTMKLYSTGAAYALLGNAHTPSTRIYTDGTIDSSGVLNGNIWIRGGGDPSLGSKYFEREGEERTFLKTWVTILLNKGITAINGSIIADGSEFGYHGAPEGWTWGDLGNYYGAGPSGCVLFDNMVKLDFQTGQNVNDPTELTCLEPHIEGYHFRNEIVSANSPYDNAYIFGAPYSFERFGKGTLPKNKTSFIVKGSIPDPELLLAQELHVALAQHISISLPPKAVRKWLPVTQTPVDYTYKTLLYEHIGKSIDAVAYWTNQKSVNLFAEQLLCLIGYNQSGDGSTTTSAKIAQNFWEPKVGSGLTISDGSGLSRKNTSSAQNFTQLLNYLYTSPHYDDFKQSLPISGKSGTLGSLCKGQPCFGKIVAKSGTMSRIKSYAGYVESSSGKTLAFAIIVNNHTISNAILTQKIQKIFNAMATY